jgi:hypothetical protein
MARFGQKITELPLTNVATANDYLRISQFNPVDGNYYSKRLRANYYASLIYVNSLFFPSLSANSYQYTTTFTNDDLVDGRLVVSHNLRKQVVSVTLADETYNEVLPDNIIFVDDANLYLYVNTDTPIVGTWTVCVIGGVTELSANPFNNYYTNTYIDQNFYTSSFIDQHYYTNTYIDQNFFTSSFIENNYYTNTYINDNYYTSTFIDQNYYTNTYIDENFFTSSFIENNYYTTVETNNIITNSLIWGNISGNINTQTDLQDEFNTKADNYHIHPIVTNLSAGFIDKLPNDATKFYNGVGNWVDISASNSVVNSAIWGSITGILSSQTDLQNEFNAKANIYHIHPIVTNLSAGFIDKLPNDATKFYNGVGNWVSVSASNTSSSSSVWGSITGILSSQTDLQIALDAKSDIGHSHSGLWNYGSRTMLANGGFSPAPVLEWKRASGTATIGGTITIVSTDNSDFVCQQFQFYIEESTTSDPTNGKMTIWPGMNYNNSHWNTGYSQATDNPVRIQFVGGADEYWSGTAYINYWYQGNFTVAPYVPASNSYGTSTLTGYTIYVIGVSDLTQITVVTAAQFSGGNFQIKTRTGYVMNPGSESAWTTVFSTSPCSG